MQVLENLKYTDTHEWIKIDGDYAYIGITDYAQDSLGSIVYIDVGEVGNEITQGEEFGAVESVKAASDLISPLSGEIIEINEDVIDNPEKVNSDPYGSWMVKIKIKDQEEIKKLLSANEYKEIVK